MQRFHPNTRDAGLARVSRITLAVVAASSVATLGLGAAIATAAPPPKSSKQKADFNADKTKPARPPTRVRLPGAGQLPSQPGQDDQGSQDDRGGQAQQQLQPPAERPESSSGDEQTTSGGS